MKPTSTNVLGKVTVSCSAVSAASSNLAQIPRAQPTRSQAQGRALESVLIPGFPGSCGVPGSPQSELSAHRRAPAGVAADSDPPRWSPILLRPWSRFSRSAARDQFGRFPWTSDACTLFVSGDAMFVVDCTENCAVQRSRHYGRWSLSKSICPRQRSCDSDDNLVVQRPLGSNLPLGWGGLTVCSWWDSSSARLLLLLRGVVRFTGRGGNRYSPCLRSPTGSSRSLQSPLVPPEIEEDGNGGRSLVRFLRLSRSATDMVPSVLVQSRSMELPATIVGEWWRRHSV